MNNIYKKANNFVKSLLFSIFIILIVFSVPPTDVDTIDNISKNSVEDSDEITLDENNLIILLTR